MASIEIPSSGGLIGGTQGGSRECRRFDVSHMGDIRSAAGEARRGAAAVQHISMNDASKLAISRAHYSAMLYSEGTFVDVVIGTDWAKMISAGDQCRDAGERHSTGCARYQDFDSSRRESLSVA